MDKPLWKDTNFASFLYRCFYGQKRLVFYIERHQTLSLGTIGQENVFHDILKRKNTFLGYKNKKFKKSKKWHFSKGDNPWFLVQKCPFFQHFFLGNIGQENVFHEILQWKSAFLGYKNKKFKTSKNWHLSKGVNPWFWLKNGNFSNFFFRHYTLGKCLLRYSRTKKTPF